VVIVARLLVRSRNTAHAPRSFFFSPLPHFVFISCAHQTTFLKKKKTYGNVFRGTCLQRGTSNLKNRLFKPKMTKKRTLKLRQSTLQSAKTSIAIEGF